MKTDKLMYGHVIINGWGGDALYLESGITKPAEGNDSATVDPDSVAIGCEEGWDGTITVYNQGLLNEIIQVYNKSLNPIT